LQTRIGIKPLADPTFTFRRGLRGREPFRLLAKRLINRPSILFLEIKLGVYKTMASNIYSI
jgi:hypothetical protein